MSRLILVRHSLPDIRREVPAAEWHLSADGIARAELLARQLDPGSATAVFSSPEPKAFETAQALAATWSLRAEAVPGLEEHLRPEAQWMSREAFEHGTVMTLFVAEVAGVEPFAFWKRQEMPFAVTLTLPELALAGTTFLSGAAGTPQRRSSNR
jgi:hypothetical protein